MEQKIMLTESQNEEIAYRLIRKKARDMLNPCSSEELGQYVRGIVDMQAEIYGCIKNTTSTG